MLAELGVKAVLAAAVVLAAAATAATAGGTEGDRVPHRACKLSAEEQRHLGASYVTSLKVRHTKCRKGKKVVRAYHECRREGNGRVCRERVHRFRCDQDVTDRTKFQYNARVACKRGSKKVVHTYTQNT